MTPEQITALAREYAEEMIKGKPSEELPNCLKNSMLKMNTEYVAEIFQWLTRRYCLVEKSKIEAVYNTTWNSWYHTLDVETKGKNQCVLDVLHFLFPEIAKEVEE